MAVENTLDDRVLSAIELSVGYYSKHIKTFEQVTNILVDELQTSEALRNYIHSIRSRVKDSSHLRDKLIRKARLDRQAGLPFSISPKNLFEYITDLAGVRLLHLHTRQMNEISKRLSKHFEERSWTVAEGPLAYTWDDESKAYFESLGIKTIGRSDSMYTSVHYVLETNVKFKIRCELQVRTLSEEIWGEISHTINYPHETPSLACREQLKALARFTSGCTRLADAIFASQDEFKKLSDKAKD